MARERDPRRDKAFEIYKESNATMNYKEIAAKLELPEKTVSSWKTRDRWDRKLNADKKVSANNNKVSANDSAKVVNEVNKKNKSGNRNPKNQFSKRNTHAVKNAIFSKYIPDESLDIMESLENKTPADILWDQIKIQYAAIIRSQKIMEVKENETIKVINKIKSEAGLVVGSDHTGEIVNEIGYELSFAFDRQANFINSLSRGMSELRNLVKQFNTIADEDDERRLKLDAMQVGIVRAELDVELKEKELQLLNDDNADKSIQINFVRK